MDGRLLLAVQSFAVLDGACLRSQQVVITGRPLIIVHSMPQRRRQSFAYQSLRYVDAADCDRRARFFREAVACWFDVVDLDVHLGAFLKPG